MPQPMLSVACLAAGSIVFSAPAGLVHYSSAPVGAHEDGSSWPDLVTVLRSAAVLGLKPVAQVIPGAAVVLPQGRDGVRTRGPPTSSRHASWSNRRSPSPAREATSAASPAWSWPVPEPAKLLPGHRSDSRGRGRLLRLEQAHQQDDLSHCQEWGRCRV